MRPMELVNGVDKNVHGAKSTYLDLSKGLCLLLSLTENTAPLHVN